MKLPYGEVTRSALKRNEPGAEQKALACLAACWTALDGIHPSALNDTAIAQLHDKPYAGCAMDVVLVLRQSPQGRKALNDLGFQKVFEHVEGNGAA